MPTVTSSVSHESRSRVLADLVARVGGLRAAYGTLLAENNKLRETDDTIESVLEGRLALSGTREHLRKVAGCDAPDLRRRFDLFRFKQVPNLFDQIHSKLALYSADPEVRRVRDEIKSLPIAVDGFDFITDPEIVFEAFDDLSGLLSQANQAQATPAQGTADENAATAREEQPTAKPVNSSTRQAQPPTRKHREKRGADLQLSRSRLAMLNEVTSEIAKLYDDVESHACDSVDELREKNPLFRFWKLADKEEQEALLEGNPNPRYKGFAVKLVYTRHFDRKPEQAKYDRKKLREAGEKPPS